MTQANLEWIQQEWAKWTETDRAKQINPSGWYKVGVEHVAHLFAAHCMEALASHAPSDLESEQRSHDAEICRIAMALGLPWPTTIEDIIKAIRLYAPSERTELECVACVHLDEAAAQPKKK